MPANAYVVEPIDDLLAETDPEGTLAPCGIRRLIIGSEALSTVVDTVSDLLSQTSEPDRESRAGVALLVDATLITRESEDVKSAVEASLRDRFDVTRTVLRDGHSELHVVDNVMDDAAVAARGMDAVVAVGGGTISDIAKVAVERARRGGTRPVLVTVQTAASVDGFTDDVSVILRDGVKRTVPSQWPDAVIADTGVIAEAPPTMNRAGFGEMTSMLVAPADWRLAALVGTDPTFKRSAVRLLGSVGEDLESWSVGIRQGRTEAVAALARALALRGIVTGVAGTTAVLSGVEHLVSHMLDQYHTEHGMPMGLHGAQVGAGAVLAASAWEMLFDRLDGASVGSLKLDAALDQEAGRVRVLAAFERVDPSLRVAEECWKDYSTKLDAIASNASRLRTVLDGWADVSAELRGLVRPAAGIAAALRSAGCAPSLAELDPHIAPDLGRWALENCALMRNRFTVVDLLNVLGWWRPADVDEVLDRAARAVPTGEDGEG